MTNLIDSVCLILHGKEAAREDVRSAVHSIRDAGCEVRVHVTWEAGDATRYSRQAIDEGSSVVVAGGGDGTVNEVLRGLVSSAPAAKSVPCLAILPLGTANDLARSCNIPLDPLDALQLAVNGPEFEVDFGTVNQKCFLNVATGGFGAEVTVATPAALKSTLGSAAYLVTGLAQFTSVSPAQVRVTGPELDWSGTVLVIAVGNGRQAGGGHQLCPQASINDGLLDVHLLPNEDLADIAGTLLLKGVDGVRRAVEISARVPWLEIEADEPIQINLDGEPISDRHFRFDVVTGQLRMKLPPDCPLLS